MVQLLDRSDDDWSAVRRNIRKARHIWGFLGEILRWEGVDLILLEEFYCAIVKSVLLFGAETWFLIS